MIASSHFTVGGYHGEVGNMVTDEKGNLFEDRRKGDRRVEQRRKRNVKVAAERRSGQDRRKKDNRN